MAYAQARPHLRFFYVAFNKSVQLEAAQKFPSNVVPRTAHALAFRACGHPHKARLKPGLRANTVMAALGLALYEDARFTIDTLNNYLISADPKVGKVVETYGSRLPGLVDDISRRAVAPDKAQILLTTAHKAKGLQWPSVLMMGDFLPLVKDGRIIKAAGVPPDEINLIYVAMTRTIFNLRFDKESALPAFIKLAQTI